MLRHTTLLRSTTPSLAFAFKSSRVQPRIAPLIFHLNSRRTVMSFAELEAKRAQVAQEISVDLIKETHELDNEKQLNEVSRSFISDTITVPTKEMYAYAVNASVGDDVYHEPTMLALEAHMAQITGKEAALFMPTGTMSNQIALRTHLKQPPYSVLCDVRCHINKYEAGGAAFHSGAHLITVHPHNGHHLTVSDVQNHIVTSQDIHTAPTEVIALENTLNGSIFPQEDIVAIAKFARSHGVKMHLDGARIWHVAAETGLSLKELLEPFDSVSLCFSKGLGAPIGSCLVGSKEYIARARWFRKLFGGGMRQTGFMAASAAYALNHNFPKLPAVHALTRKLEQGLKDIGVGIIGGAETCMVFFDPSPIGVDYADIVARASQLPQPIKLGGSRLVVHIQTSPAAVDDFLTVVRELAEEKKKAGFVPAPMQLNGSAYGNAYKDIYVRLSK